jgi:hypothetical protein
VKDEEEEPEEGDDDQGEEEDGDDESAEQKAQERYRKMMRIKENKEKTRKLQGMFMNYQTLD